MVWRAKGTVLSLGAAVAIATVPSLAHEPAREPVAPPAPTPGDDLRVRAFAQAYAELIDSVTYGESDVVFFLGEKAIQFRDGRMLERGRGPAHDAECDPLFYRYSLRPLSEPPEAPEEMPRYCTDVLESLWGSTEEEIRSHGSSIRFLDHRMFVNDFLIEPLATVERALLIASVTDPAIAEWIESLDVTYSFIDRGIAGSPTRSHHAWGLAIDLVPTSYDGRQVYWRWSRVYDREAWDRIPLDQRWSPPEAVVAIFEQHGFVWGGKWAHFDMIHFEYRPEIILYNRLLSGAAS